MFRQPVLARMAPEARHVGIVAPADDPCLRDVCFQEVPRPMNTRFRVTPGVVRAPRKAMNENDVNLEVGRRSGLMKDFDGKLCVGVRTWLARMLLLPEYQLAERGHGWCRKLEC